MDYNEDKMDEVVLALLWMNAFSEKVGHIDAWRAWKSMPWEATDRLYEKNLISDPKSKAKSVALTDEGRPDRTRGIRASVRALIRQRSTLLSGCRTQRTLACGRLALSYFW